MTTPTDPILDWLDFFRDVGVTDISVSDPPPPPPPPPEPAAVLGQPAAAPRSLSEIPADLGDCRRCKLHTTRTNIVFGVGPENAELVFVGEAPGENEDLKGEPFVGRAGDLLTKMIVAMGYTRQEVYIANVIKCRPPGNRDPDPDEIAACRPFLERQLDTIRPKVIVALGAFAAQLITGSSDRISLLRGRFHEFRGIKVMPTFHPSYLLQSPSKKKEAWSDLQQVMKLLGKIKK